MNATRAISSAAALGAAALLALAGAALAGPEVGSPATREACEAAGGSWKHAGLAGGGACDLPAKDAGKPCVNDADCQSVCVADAAVGSGEKVSGHCYERTLITGQCLNRVRDGVARGVMCTD